MGLLSFFTKRNRFLFLLLPLLVVSATALIYYRAPIEVFSPEHLDEWEIKIERTEIYHGSEGTDPQLKVLYFDNRGLSYTYRLIDTIQNLMVLRLFRKDRTTLDLSAYDEVTIESRCSHSKRFPFSLVTPNTQAKAGTMFGTRYYIAMPDATTDFQHITLDLKEMKTPRIWYGVNNLTEESAGPQDLSQVSELVFQNDLVYVKHNGTEVQDVVEVKSIRFSRNLIPLYWFSAFVFALSALLLLWWEKRKTVGIDVVIPYHQVKASNREANEKQQIFSYLQTNYQEPELSLSEVQTATGIHERKISSLIKKETGQNFKQYLNSLRIAEAKKLLEEGSLPISEIAYKVGYANVTHFNKVFKSAEQTAPKDYRKDGFQTL